jgi:DNA-directed RNA polymerase specialized sigma24 family protein
VELLMRELTGRERDMLGLSLQGYDVAEISGRVARTERTVQRVLKRVRERLEELRREPPATP